MDVASHHPFDEVIGIGVAVLVVIVALFGANFASDSLVQKVNDAYGVALSEKRYVKVVALGVVRWWLDGARH